MIGVYPSRRAVLLTAAGAPVALAVAVAAPQLWIVALGWILFAAGLSLVDLALAPPRSRLSAAWTAPPSLGVGRAGEARLALQLSGGGERPVEVAVCAAGPLSAEPERRSVALQDGEATADFRLTAARRGEGRIDGLWARWRGPLGLVWVQKTLPAPPPIPVIFDIDAVRGEALRLFSRDAPLGLRSDLESGQGSEFHALREFQHGMDARTIDWKQSARHGKLVAREHRTERNHNIVLAIDSSRLMSAPTTGLSRLDQSINSAMLLAYVALKTGDRVSLFSFDARPRVASGFLNHTGAFGALQRLAARIDYSTEEANFPLGLNTLSGTLDRRSLIVMFTDFIDPTSAELMIENVARLIRKHLVLFVAFRETALETLAETVPSEADDVSRAVVAGALLQKRRAVIARLARMGALIVEPGKEGLNAGLLNAYLDAKRRELV